MREMERVSKAGGIGRARPHDRGRGGRAGPAPTAGPAGPDAGRHQLARLLRAARREASGRAFPLSLKGLAAGLGIAPAAVARKLDELVGRGLLRRQKAAGMVGSAPLWKWVGE